MSAKAYVSVFRIRLFNGLQYRSAALAGIATQFFWGFLTVMVFQAFYAHASVEPPISLSQLVTYIWLQQAFLSFIALWLRDNELFQLITTGNIAYELCRPTGLYGFWYAKLFAQRLANAALRCLPILIAALLLPSSYRLSPPSGFGALVCFAAALSIGLLLLVAISLLIYISVFVTMSPVGSLLLFVVVGEFCAGLIVPIPLMPDWLQPVMNVLPFRYTADFPFRVYSGHIGMMEALTGIGIQLLWLFALVVFGKWSMNRALRRVVVQGG